MVSQHVFYAWKAFRHLRQRAILPSNSFSMLDVQLVDENILYTLPLPDIVNRNAQNWLILGEVSYVWMQVHGVSALLVVMIVAGMLTPAGTQLLLIPSASMI